MNELYTLENNHYESGNKYKMYDFPDKRIMIWTDFQRINATHFKARFGININRLKDLPWHNRRFSLNNFEHFFYGRRGHPYH